MNKIKEYRYDRGLTQKELAEKIGIDQPLVAKYEKGTKNPKLEQLKKIANVLECSYLDLIDDNEIEHHVITYVKSKWNIDLGPLK